MASGLSHEPERNDDDGAGNDRPDQALDPERERRLRTERLEEIRQYFRDRQARRKPVRVTRTPLGQVLDWIPIESQVRDGRVADPPDAGGLDLTEIVKHPADDHSRETRQVELLPFELLHERAERGPHGTVPIVQRDVDRITTAKSFQDFMSKHGRALRLQPDSAGRDVALPEDGTVHKYAYSAQWVTCYGCEGNINAWDPYVEWSDEFSLGQCAIARGSGGSKQTVEAGHQEYRDRYGDWVPHLFIYYTTNGYTSSGDNIGGYNQDVDGWVQYSPYIYPEALSSPLSSFGGTQYIMNLKWQLYESNWWLRVNGRWIGYYPAGLFATFGLRNEAEKTAWYGEVVDSAAHAGTTRTDMGNGHWPYEGWRHCAYMSNLAYQSDTAGVMARYNPATVYASDPKCYAIEGHFDNAGSWAPYFWWGGAGKNSQCP
jgi:Neprosin